MKKSHVIILVILLLPCMMILLNNRGVSSTIENNIVFKQKLSEYGLYQGKISDLKPCEEAERIEIASALFTDYAEKQRIILLPKGEKMKAKGNGLPDFPDGTIIAKTFYYNKKTKDKADSLHILETRLLIKHQDQWNASTYQWNDIQSEAYLINHGATTSVAFTDEKGNSRTTNYKVPSRTDCISCHRLNDKIFPIGLKLQNINTAVNIEKGIVNQVEYFKQKGKLEITDISKIASAIDYRNENETLEKRARAYLNINCAHCHNPNGIGNISQLDLRAETSIDQTGIWFKQGKIAYRMTIPGELHMPKLGTTIPHDEGVQLILDYIKNLD